MTTGPAQFYVIRHAEKPGGGGRHDALGVDERGRSCGSSLTPRGWQRAGALVRFFAPTQGQSPAGPAPAVILVPDHDKDLADHRTTQTVAPLGRALGIALSAPVPEGQEAKLVSSAILTAASWPVLVCWEHHHIPDIVAAVDSQVGAKEVPSVGKEWPDDDFDSVLVFTRDHDGRYTCRRVPQQLLEGDAEG